MSDRFAVRHGFGETKAELRGLRHVGLAMQISRDMPDIIRMAHDSGDAEVVFHCPFCGSGQVIARNDGTIECEFCSACFTVQVQPQYPAFPQTINGQPINVPGMGPQWPGQEQDPGAGLPVSPDDQDGDGVPDEEEAEEEAPGGEEQEAPDEEDGGNPFAKKSFRTASGAELDLDRYLRHVALATTRNRPGILSKIRRENGKA
jgi:hypothetical protein